MTSRRLALNARIVEADVARAGLVRFRAADGLVASRRPAPSLFALPGLTARPVWGGPTDLRAAGHGDLAEALAQLEQAAPEMLAEYDAAAGGVPSKADDDYVKGDHESLLHAGAEWTWSSLMSKGQRRALAAAPRTARLLDDVPRLMAGVPFGFAFFSALKPGGIITPHSAPMNLRLRVHLGLRVPPKGDLGLRVGPEVLRWRDGTAFAFDDAYVHEVWNHTVEDRLIFLFDVWHPDLHDDEIDAIKVMFQAAQEQQQARASAAEEGQSD